MLSASTTSSAMRANSPPRSARMGWPACSRAKLPSRKSCALRARIRLQTMGAFEYTALDSVGRSRKGVMEGDTARHVRSLLREQQLLPVTIEEVAAQESRRQLRPGIRFGRGLSAAD